MTTKRLPQPDDDDDGVAGVARVDDVVSDVALGAMVVEAIEKYQLKVRWPNGRCDASNSDESLGSAQGDTLSEAVWTWIRCYTARSSGAGLQDGREVPTGS